MTELAPDRGPAARVAWPLAAITAVLAAAWWLRQPGGAPVGAACVAAAGGAWWAARRDVARTRGILATVAVVVLAATLGVAERSRRQSDRFPERLRAARDSAAVALLRDAFATWQQRLTYAATEALSAPADPDAAFNALDLLPDGTPEAGVVLFRDGRPVAWRGTVRVPLVGARDSAGTIITPFYVAVYAAAARGADRAIATVLVHAAPPADRFARTLDRQVADRAGVRGFLVAPPVDGGGAPVFRVRGVPVLAALPVALSDGALALEVAETGRRVVGAVLVVAVALLLVATWHTGAPMTGRLGVLAAAVACAILAPLSAYSNVTRLFDPAVYFTSLGGPLTASLAALLVTGAAVVVALLTLRRSWRRAQSRAGAVGVVVLVAVAGPYLLRDLSRGIAMPADGASTFLWVAWQLGIFLAAMALLLVGTWAGRVVLGASRGAPVWAAPVVAIVAALVAPVLWRAPAGWPEPYVLMWCMAVGLLTVARRGHGHIVAAALVAACGAESLVWGAVARARAQRAAEDVANLRSPDASAAALLARLANALAGDPPPPSREALLTRYADADLVAAGYPVHLASWAPDADEPVAQVAVAAFADPREALGQAVAEARRQGRGVAVLADVAPWHELIAAVPHDNGYVTTVVVGPRTRLLADEPWAGLLGLTRGGGGEPPYDILLGDGGGASPTDTPRWSRRGSAILGDWVIVGSDGPLRVQASVDLRPLDAIWQRGVLLGLLDVAVALLLWGLHATARPGLSRWVRGRVQLIRRSFRARLTLALYAFALVPVLAFAVWSVRRIGLETVRSRELVVQELLRNALAPGGEASLEMRAQRADAPLLVYRDGELLAASEPLFSALAPAGRYLPAAVQRDLDFSAALTATAVQRVGTGRALLGYRAASPLPSSGELTVVASPARADDPASDRQRADLAVLLIVAAVAAALAAWWLSGIAALALATPIRRIGEGIAAVAAGERPALPPEAAPVEFAGVFGAFSRMADQLGESRVALEEAQRRTAAVLRQVASGVVAVDEHGAVTLANPSAESLLGVPLPAGTPLALFADAGLAATVRGFLAGGAPLETFDLRAGSRQWRGSLARLLRGGAVLTLDDVTALARAQRVLAWGEMARQVAHEIKNPLTPIRLGVQHLRRSFADGREDFGRILDENAGRILAEIDRLDEIARTFSRYGTPAEAQAPAEPVDAAATARDVVALEQLGASAVTWKVHAAEVPAWVLAREAELREVLLNLLENARQAGARHVALSVERAGREVVLRVRDDGHGIPDDVLPRVFEPHFSTTTSGSGLGLAISRRLVEGWGGRIALETRVGAGTTVSVALVAALAPREIPA
ncbi:MAG: ATP-binding protein [Gemmatimonadota bacterium]|jgi:signal transduction histidine kinase